MHDRIYKTIARFKAVLGNIDTEVVGRTSIIQQIGFALLTRQHILIEGPPGIAKSYMAKKVFERITGARTFHIQCTRKMTEDSLVGPPNVRVLREEGRFEHNVDGTMVTAHYGFLDEVLDLSSGALRALLEILNERTFSRGSQRVSSPLQTAIATTNFNREGEEELAAVLDRFLFKAKITPLTTKAERKKMLLLSGGGEKVCISRSDLEYLQRSVKKVKIPKHVLDTYLDVCSNLTLTDRRVMHSLDVLRACALMEGRMQARVEDIGRMEVVFVTTGDRNSENLWGNALRPYADALEEEQNRAAMVALLDRLSQLRYLANQEDSYKGIQDVAVETAKAQTALEMLKSPATAKMHQTAMGVANEILAIADKLYKSVEAV